MLLQGINFDNIHNNHKVLEELTKKGLRFRFKNQWDKGLNFMPCTKFNIYYESFDVLDADKDLSRSFKGRENMFYNKYELEDIFERTFHILKLWNPNYLELFNIYLNYVSTHTIFKLDLEDAKDFTEMLDEVELSFKDLMSRYSKSRNWNVIPNSGIKNFQRDLAYDQKLFNNRELLKKALNIYEKGDVVTMSRLGLSNQSYLWRNIESLIGELNSYTEMPQREDALYTISEAWRYCELVSYKPSINEVQSQVGGSRRMIKLAMMYFYEKDKVVYEIDSKEVIEKIQSQVSNPLSYSYEMVKKGDKFRLILTEKTQ